MIPLRTRRNWKNQDYDGRNRKMEKLVIVYFVTMNLIGVMVMAADKRKAIKHKWRIPEKVLFLVALLGGSAGTWGGMYLFHHKTKHWYFVIGMPLIFVIQVILGIMIKYFL